MNKKAVRLVNELTLELDVNGAMRRVRAAALELLGCERVTLFLVSRARRELRGRAGDDEGSRVIRVGFNQGIAGHVAAGAAGVHPGRPLNVRDAYAHPLFCAEADARTGFRTRNMLCCAVPDASDRSRPAAAVLQALNKRGGADFSQADERHLGLFSTHLAATLARARLHAEARRERERLAALGRCFKALASAVRCLFVCLCCARSIGG